LVKRILDRDVSFLGWPCSPQRRDLRLSVFKRGQRATIIAPAEAALAVSPVRRTQLKGGGNFHGRSCRGVWGPALARRPRRILKGPTTPATSSRGRRSGNLAQVAFGRALRPRRLGSVEPDEPDIGLAIVSALDLPIRRKPR